MWQAYQAWKRPAGSQEALVSLPTCGSTTGKLQSSSATPPAECRTPLPRCYMLSIISRYTRLYPEACSAPARKLMDAYENKPKPSTNQGRQSGLAEGDCGSRHDIWLGCYRPQFVMAFPRRLTFFTKRPGRSTNGMPRTLEQMYLLRPAAPFYNCRRCFSYSNAAGWIWRVILLFSSISGLITE
ncbi:unnamed protein product [Symbiodinium sp. CCMP2592]|nr:unnamed protein product [Symbiodinium sp. CCMP2592]